MRFLFFILCFLPWHSCLSQTITTIAGGGVGLGEGGPATLAHIANPGGGFFDNFGNYYFLQAAFANPRLRMIDNFGLIHTIAGTGIFGFSGDGGPASAASFRPQGMTMDTSGNIYIADYYNNRIRKIDGVTGIINTIAGTGLAGVSGDGGPALSANMSPGAVCVSRSGDIYFVDGGGYYVRKINSGGIVSTIAGTGVAGYGGDGGPATDAELATNNSVCLDNHGNLYLACDLKVRKIDLATGIISTFAGTGGFPYIGDGMPATDAQFGAFQIGYDTASSALYIADIGSNRVYQVDATNVFHLVAGNGSTGFSGDGGPATAAQLHSPQGVATDICGNLYIAVSSNNRVRKVQFSSTDIPTVTISVSPNDTLCSGVPGSFNCSLVAMTGSTYQWYVNGVPVSGTASAYSYTPTDGDSVYCKVTGIATCSGNTVTRFSNGVKITVLPATTVSLSLTPSPNDTVCEGTAVSIAASASGGAASPGYHWYKNGFPVLGGASYSFTPATADSVSCVFVSNATCPVPNDTVEQHVKFTVLPYVTPALGISSSLAPEGSICEGDTVHFSSSVSGGGASPVLQWKVNGVDVAAGATYAYSPSDGDTVHCVLTSSEMCTTSATATSNTIGPISVHPVVIPAVVISATASFANAGETVTVNAVVSGTSTYSIKWYLNSVYHATTALPQTTFVKGSGIDIITARVIPTGVLCLDSTDSAPLAVAIPNAISEVQTVQTLTLYPNPVSNTLHVSSTTKLHYVTITDAVGKQLKTEKVTARSAALDLRDLPPGIYLLTAYDDVGKVGSATITRN